MVTISKKLLIAALVVAATGSYQLYAMEPANVAAGSAEEKMADCSICCKSYSNSSNIRISTSCCNQELCMNCLSKITLGGAIALKCPFCRATVQRKQVQEMLKNAKQKCVSELNALAQELQNAVCCSIKNYNLDRVKSILQKADFPYRVVSSRDMYGYTQLHMASGLGHVEIVKLFLAIAEEAGGVQDLVTKKSTLGGTALDLAKANGHMDVVNLLESYEIQ